MVLGDSYSAGNGARSEQDRRLYPGVETCYRNKFNWGERYKKLLSARYDVTLDNHACSGAKIQHIFGTNYDRYRKDVSIPVSFSVTNDNVEEWLANTYTWPEPCGVNELPTRLEESWRMENIRVTLSTTGGVPHRYAKFTCIQTVDPQVEYVDDTVDLVVMTAGGNDLGFDDIIKGCYAPGLRGRGVCKARIAEAREGLQNVQVALGRVIARLYDEQRIRPDTKVVVMGYPLQSRPDGELNPGDSAEEWEYALPKNSSYHPGEEVRELGTIGNIALGQTINGIRTSGVAYAKNVSFISEVPVNFAKKEPDPRWKHYNSLRAMWEIPKSEVALWRRENLQEWYHPNNKGQQIYAETLASGDGYVAYDAGANRKRTGDLDVVFVIDSSESMSDHLAAVKTEIARLVGNVAARANSSRFGVVTYREDPRFSADPADYASRLELDFTRDPSQVAPTISKITAKSGGGNRETMLSGLDTALDLRWRPRAKKALIVLSDNGPHDPEPFTGIDGDDIIEKAWAVDPAAVSIVDLGNAMQNADLPRVVRATGGLVATASDPADAPAALESVLNGTLERPDAWINGPYLARVGDSITVDGAGSSGFDADITQYAWDFDGDHVADEVTASPTIDHAWPAPYSGMIGLEVTDPAGRTSLASTYIKVTSDGDVIPTEQDNCPDDENVGQSDYDEDGIGDECDPTPGWDTVDPPVRIKESSLSGAPYPGNTLTADPGVWDVPVRVQYQWYRDGTEIAGSTAPDYTLTEADVRHRVSVKILVRDDEYGLVSSSTHARDIEPLPITREVSSSLKGEPRPWHRLVADPGRWDKPISATYQWTRDGVAIPGATNSTYTVLPTDVHHRIAVTITTSAEHYGVISEDTHGARVERFTSSTDLRLKNLVVREGKTVKAKVTLLADGFPQPIAGRLRFSDGGETILTPLLRAKHPATVTFKLRDLAVGKHRIWVRYFGNHLVKRSRSQMVKVVVKPATAPFLGSRYGR